MPFTFLLGLGAFAVAILWMVDVDKSRLECRRYLDEEATKVYSMTKVSTAGQRASAATFLGGENDPTGEETDVDDKNIGRRL
jgi:hypothetical protein